MSDLAAAIPEPLRDFLESIGLPVAELTQDQLSDIVLAPRRYAMAVKLSELDASDKPLFDKATIKSIEDVLDAAVSALNPSDVKITWKAWNGDTVEIPATWNFDLSKSLPFVGFNQFEDMLKHNNACPEPETCRMTFTPYMIDLDEYPKPGELNAKHWTKEFDAVVYKWSQSDHCKKLISVLEKCGEVVKTIDKIICFGNGDLHPHGCDDHRYGSRSAYQHAAALTIQAFLQEKNGREIPLLAQDPGYTAPVIEVLEAKGFVIYKGVRRGSQGFLDVDDNTFVMSISPTIPVFNIITEFATPVVVMKDGWFKDEQEEKDWCKDNNYPYPMGNRDSMEGAVKELLAKEYDEMVFLTEKFFRGEEKGPFANVFVYSHKGHPVEDKKLDEDVDLDADMAQLTVTDADTEPGCDGDDDGCSASGSEAADDSGSE